MPPTMPKTMPIDKRWVAATEFVDSLHQHYEGIQIQPIANYEDEDLTFQVTIPQALSLEEVLETCHQECIKTEDEYDLFILPLVVYENGKTTPSYRPSK